MTERAIVTDVTADVANLTGRLAEVYREAFCVPPYDEPPESAERFAAEQLPTHAGRDGFRLVGAFGAFATAHDPNAELLGFAYGYTGERGQWWSDWVSRLAPADVVGTWLGGHFEVVEVAVRAAAQGQGLGGRLHDALLDGLPHERALLTTYRADRPAPRLYRRKGLAGARPGPRRGERPLRPRPASAGAVALVTAGVDLRALAPGDRALGADPVEHRAVAEAAQHGLLHLEDRDAVRLHEDEPQRVTQRGGPVLGRRHLLRIGIRGSLLEQPTG